MQFVNAIVTNHLRAPKGVYFTKKTRTILQLFRLRMLPVEVDVLPKTSWRPFGDL